MSYILDALKKSEQERGKGNIPGIQTMHSSSLNYRREKTNYWPYILVTTVILNLLAIIYYLAEKETPTEVVIAEQQTTSKKHVATENHIAPVTIEKTEIPAQEANTSNINSSAQKKITVEKTPATNNNQPTNSNISTEPTVTSTNNQAIINETNIIDFHELPDSIKQVLPTITISAHVYSSNPTQRSIVINNNFMEESEYVLDGLILYEITPNGAIFNYEGTLFSYGVVSGWQ